MTSLGWRSVFYICGAIGVIWAFWWYVSYRNLPEEHGMVNRAELARVDARLGGVLQQVVPEHQRVRR